MGERVGYLRVSTADQNTERQLDGVPVDRVFEDKASGRSTDRPALAEALRFLRDGDTFVVHSMDRLARNVDDLRRIVRELTARGVRVEFLKEGLAFAGDDSPMNNLLLTMLGAVAEFERELIRQRQAEGIAAAKKRGAYKGRPRSLKSDQIRSVRNAALAGTPKVQIAREHGISRSTLYRYLERIGPLN